MVNLTGVTPKSATMPGQLIAQAAALHQKGSLAEAARLYLRILRVNPDHFDAQQLLGILRHQEGRHAEALELIGGALKTNPKNVGALSSYALVLAKLKRYEDALASYDRVLAMKADFVEALINRGNILQELHRLEDALASYDKALVIKPDSTETLYNRGNILRDLNRFEDALASYDKALAIKPDHVGALNNRGNILRDLNRFEDALASYDKALAIKPDFAEALNNRGVTLQKLNRSDDALASYDKALALKPDYVDALSNRGNVLLDLNRLVDALASYDKALALKPDSAEVMSQRSILLMELGRLAEARQAIERAIQLAPKKTLFYRVLGEVSRYGAGDPSVAAMEELAKDTGLLSIDDRIELHFALAKAYDDLGRPERAFGQLLAGNALKRRQIAYDEAATLRMLERVREVFTPELIRSRQGVGDPSPLPVFVVGMPRSGTTLVEQILASHRQVFGAGELKYFGKVVAKLGAQESGSRAFPDLVSHMSSNLFRQLAESYLVEIKRLAPEAVRIIDKMPSNYVFVGLIHLALPNARIIHTVRDPVDTCISCFSKLFDEQNYTYDLAELGRYYRHYQTLMAHWYKVLPPRRILEVRYEDVVADLEGAARRIIAHCGLEWDARCLAFHQTERPVRTYSALQVRQPIYKTSVGRRHAYEAFLAPLLGELERT